MLYQDFNSFDNVNIESQGTQRTTSMEFVEETHLKKSDKIRDIILEDNIKIK